MPKLENICDDIISNGYDIVAFSCYIWNIDYIKPLCELLKQKKKDIIIILGGPEVTYEPEHFISNYKIDYVMSGEGEETFPQLLTQIENNIENIAESLNVLNNSSSIFLGVKSF